MNVIVFFCNHNMLPGLHAAITSLLINSTEDSEFTITIFTDHINSKGILDLNQTFKLYGKRKHLFETKECPKNLKIDGANSLHGNFTAYGRLFIGELILNASKVIYLDCDLIIHFDINILFNKINDNYVLTVDGNGEMSWSLDKELYKNAGFNLRESCFNSGVLGINLSLWKKQNIFQKFQDIIKLYPNQFLSADQAVLNVAFYKNYLSLGNQINYTISPCTKENLTEFLSENRIYHFVGSPKPWDPLGKHVHKGYDLWYFYFAKSSIAKSSLISYFSLKRTIFIIKSYSKLIKTLA